MKIYCSSCDKIQPAIIDNCRDAKTNEPYQDIVCEDCHLVIASGKDIKRPWVGLTDEEIEDLYFDKFSMGELKAFARAIEAKLKEKNTQQDGDCKHCVNGCSACDARRQPNVLS